MRRWLAVLLTLPLLVACSDGKEVVEGPTTTAEDDAGDDNGPGATVELLDPGAEPRQVLRLHPPADCEQPVTQRQTISQRAVSGSVDGKALTDAEIASISAGANGQSTEMDLTFRCEEVDANRIAVVNHYDDLRVLEALGGEVETLEQLFGDLEGAEGRIVLDPQGRVLDAEPPDVEIDEDTLGPAFAQAMESMLQGLGDTMEQSATPLPTEAVGVGARWRVTSAIDFAGIAARSISEYTITRIEGDQVDAELAISMEFDPGAVEFPGTPPGASAEIVSGSMAGTGTTTWNLDGVVAASRQIVDGALTMRIRARDGAIELSMEQHQELKLEPR